LGGGITTGLIRDAKSVTRGLGPAINFPSTIAWINFEDVVIQLKQLSGFESTFGSLNWSV
jgi:hypothetical protein